jgi:hypothetical protein
MKRYDREVIRPGDLTAQERNAIAAAEVPPEFAHLDDEVTASMCASGSQSPAGISALPLFATRRMIGLDHR